MKKIIYMFIAIFLVLCSACTISVSSSPDSSGSGMLPSQTPDVIQITKEMLTGYSIVYPSNYNEYRMEDVYSLRDAVSLYVNESVDTLSDEKDRTEKLIILADSKLEHQYSNTIYEFNGTLNSIIAIDGQTQNIIIGGSNYYATVIAIERFVKMLSDAGSDAIDLTYSRDVVLPVKVPVVACTLKTQPFSTLEQFEAMVAQGYNSVVIDGSLYTERQLHNVIKWCAKYNVNLVMRSYVSRELYQDCPIMLGHLIVDEPYGYDSYLWYSIDCKKYADACAQYGWKPYVNLIGQDDIISALENDKNLFPAVGAMSIKLNQTKVIDAIAMLGKIRDYMQSIGKDYVAGVDLSNAFVGYSVEDSSFLRAVLGISFGSYGVQCFCYSGNDHSDDDSYEITDASKLISSINNLTSAVDGYEQAGSVYFGGWLTLVYGDTAYNDIFAEALESYNLKDCLISDFVNSNGEHKFVVLNINKINKMSFVTKKSPVSVVNSDGIKQDCDEFEVSGIDFVVVEINAEE